MPGTTGSTFSTLFSESFQNRTRSTDPQALLLAAIGASDESGRPFASELELANPLPFLLLNQVIRPALDATLPVELSELLETLVRGPVTVAHPGGAAPASAEDIDALKRLVTELQATVQAQGEEIRRLREENR